MEREVGGGIGMGNTGKSMADLCQCIKGTTAILWSDWPPTDKNKWRKKAVSLFNVTLELTIIFQMLFTLR